MTRILFCTTATLALVGTLASPAFAAEGEQAAAVQSDAASSNAQPAAAPEAQDDGSAITDIVVTAQRRREAAQDVPVAISAFSGDQLQAQGVSSTADLGQFVPNLAASNNTGIGSANTYFMRGLGNSDSFATVDSPVGTYVDDIYLSRQNANNLSLFDVDRIEVLRGPQGTLFGRNTTGGAINVIMKDPGKDLDGYAEIGYGSYNKKAARGSVDIPLAPSFSIKLSGYWQNDDGYVHNVTTGERLNDDDGWGARLGIRGDLSDHVRWRASYAHIVANGENILNFACNPADPTQCNARYVTTGFRADGKGGSPFEAIGVTGAKADLPQGNWTKTDIVTSNLGIDIAPHATINLITGYVNTVNNYALDFFDGRGAPSISNPYPAVGGYPFGGFTLLNEAQSNQFTQEIKLNAQLFNGAVDLVAGGFYLDENNRTDIADIYGVSSTFALVLGDRLVKNGTESLAGYAQADVHITPKLTVTGGIRYTDERKDFWVHDNRPSCNDGTLEATCLDMSNLTSPSGLAIPTKLSTKLWTPHFGISYKPNSDVMLYATATKGFRSGGWNARATKPSLMVPYGPEQVWSYEGGIKSEWLDHRVRVNITGYWSKANDLQVPASLVSPTGGVTFVTRNFADFRDYGLEGEFVIVPIRNLNLWSNVGWQRAKYIIDRSASPLDQYGIQSVAAQQAACLAQLAGGNIPGGPGTASCGAGIIAPDGSIAQPIRTPKWTIALGGSYKAELGGSGLSLVPSINATYHSKSQVGISNFSIYSGSITGTNGTFPTNPYSGGFITGSLSKGAWLFNADLALNGPNDRWQVGVGCQNCFNAKYLQSQIANYSYLNPPRAWMARLRYHF